jgi:glycosyltransferase involved in cell wall biosynthesis
MKVLYLNLDRGIPVLGDKGASVHVRAFVAAAAELGHEVALACPVLGEGNPPPPARLVELAYEPGPTSASWRPGADEARDLVVRREQARLAYDISAPSRIVAAVDGIGFRPDVVYERHALFHSAGVRVAEHYGVPRLLEVNAPLVEEQRKYRGLHLEAAAREAELESYRGADAIIAVSDAVAAYVGSVMGGGGRIHVEPNGVDLARFAVRRPAESAVRRRLGLGSAPIIGFIGSFKPWHGVGFLLDVFVSLAPERPDLRLIAVGEGPEREAISARVAALGLTDRVILPGRAPHAEIPAWLEAMDLTAAPYLPQDDFYFSPLKIIESLAAGRPVVAPRIGQIAAVVDDRVNGRLYTPGDAAGCRAAITALINDPARLASMGAQARQSVARCGWNEAVARILALAPPRGDREAAA